MANLNKDPEIRATHEIQIEVWRPLEITSSRSCSAINQAIPFNENAQNAEIVMPRTKFSTKFNIISTSTKELSQNKANN